MAQNALQRTITWTEKSKNSKQEWKKSCIEAKLPPRILRTPVKTRFALKIILF
jgi:hypothetical protein